jgi:hypothetical protein
MPEGAPAQDAYSTPTSQSSPSIFEAKPAGCVRLSRRVRSRRMGRKTREPMVLVATTCQVRGGAREYASRSSRDPRVESANTTARCQDG